jgi:hypothetical protein
MRLNAYFRLALAMLPLAICTAAVVDRVAIVIGKRVVTESEVLDDLRLTEFINGEPLELEPAARRAAADRLIDQELIHGELEMSGYATPPAAEGDALLRKFRQTHFHSIAEYHASMRKYGIDEDQLERRLLWQLTAIQFTNLRFGSQSVEAAPASPGDTTVPPPASVDQQMDAWLKQARADTTITMKPEAFQ